MSDNFSLFKKQITHPVKFRLFLFNNLPAAWFGGFRIEALSETQAEISIKYKWFNKNPFRSIYFAMLSAAAEVSTGVLCMGHIYKQKPAVSMLVVENKGKFFKKATGKIIFKCESGSDIIKAIETAKQTGEGVEVRCISKGRNENNEIVAEFEFVWSLKIKS